MYDVLFWIFFIISVITVLWYIFGDSPTIEQALLVLIITFLFKIQSIITINSVEIKSIKHKFGLLENSFMKSVKDFKKFINSGK